MQDKGAFGTERSLLSQTASEIQCIVVELNV